MATVIPGQWLLADGSIEINVGRKRRRLSVRNTGDRAIQVGSHFHFFEANHALEFRRSAAFGMRLDVPSGQSIRFEAGDERDVELVQFGGIGLVIGFNDLVDGGYKSPDALVRATERAARLGFATGPEVHDQPLQSTSHASAPASRLGTQEH